MSHGKPHVDDSHSHAKEHLHNGHAHEAEITRGCEGRVRSLKMSRKCDTTYPEVTKRESCKE